MSECSACSTGLHRLGRPCSREGARSRPGHGHPFTLCRTNVRRSLSKALACALESHTPMATHVGP